MLFENKQSKREVALYFIKNFLLCKFVQIFQKLYFHANLAKALLLLSKKRSRSQLRRCSCYSPKTRYNEAIPNTEEVADTKAAFFLSTVLYTNPSSAYATASTK